MPQTINKPQKKQQAKRIRQNKAINQKMEALGNPTFLVNLFLRAIKEETKLLQHARMKLLGRPREHSDAIIALGVMIHLYFHLPYRQTRGFLQFLLSASNIKIPCFKTLQRRAQEINLSQYLPVTPLRGQRSIAIDSTGLVPSNRGHYICYKWDVEVTTRQGFIKAHFVVDTRSHRILTAEFTNNHTGDSTGAMQLLPKLFTRRKNIRRCLGDRAYDSKQIFNLLARHRIKPGIRTRKNAVPRSRGCPARSTEVYYLQTAGYEAWKQSRHYGDRQAVEQTNGVFKNRFGERVVAKSELAIQAELWHKVAIFNWEQCFVPS